MIKRFVQFVLAGLLIAAGGLAAITAWAGASAASDPGQVEATTGYSPALLGVLETQRASPVQGVKATPSPGPQELLRRAPLSVAPLALVGLEALARQDVDGADRAFAGAFRRNPRSDAARIWLAQRAIDTRHMDEAIAMLDGLIAISPERMAAFTEALAQLATLPGGAKALETRLSSTPRWGGEVVSRLNKTMADTTTLLQLNLWTPPTQREFVARLMKEAGPEAAFRAWLNFVPPEEVKDFRWPYDGDFRKRPPPPPFNWTTYTDLVEFSSDGGLSATYLGRGRLTLVDETMLLGPGQYHFASQMTGEARDNGGGFGWTIECMGSAELGRVVVRSLSDRPSTEAFDFVVPASGCNAQRLLMRGEPGEFPIRARVQVHSVSLERQASGMAK